jgi:hypothetical protein
MQAMCPTDLPAMDSAEAVDAKGSYRQLAAAVPSWRGFLPARLLAGAAWVVFVLFIYLLMSFHSLLQPAFTTTEAVLALVLLGLVIGRA